MEFLFAIIILLIGVLVYKAIYYAHKYHIVQEENEVLRKLVFREENEEIYRWFILKLYIKIDGVIL